MGTKIKLILFLACLPYLLAKPLDEDEFVIVSPGPVSESTPVKEIVKPNIKSMHINSNITNRFSHTLVKSVIQNPSSTAQEVTFFVVLTEQAFISSFIMEIQGKEYIAYVQEKKAAKKTYDDAVSSGRGAAHVSVRDSNQFVVNVNLEANSEATFYLTCEELLERSNGIYEQLINVHPGQIVDDLKIEVLIEEEIPISYINVPAIRSGNAITAPSAELEPSAKITKLSDRSVVITFSPCIKKQKAIAHGLSTEENEGMAGQFVVQYDVEREPNGGTVLVKDGHMVHFFAPSDLKPLKRHIVMIVDTSGSMWGQKMTQLKEAMKVIFDKMNENDLVSLVNFESNVKVWNFDAPEESTYFPGNDNNYGYYNPNEVVSDLKDFSFPPTYRFTKFNHEKALNFVDGMEATGGTNIYDGLRVGLHLVKLHRKRTQDDSHQPIIFFLTDGAPSAGKVDTVEIVQGIAEENSINVPIMTLAFGDDANPDLLQKIGFTNHGIMRQIYIDSDTGIQLKNFFELTTNPQLHDVKFKYTPDVVSMTTIDIPVFFSGSEIVIAAKIPENGLTEIPVIECFGPAGPMVLRPIIIEIKNVGQLERLWAYLTEKMYLRQAKIAEANDKSPAEDNAKALELALKYSFVTPLTSLVVVKPDATDAVDTTKVNQDIGELVGAMPSGKAGIMMASMPVNAIMGAPAGGIAFSSYGGVSGAGAGLSGYVDYADEGASYEMAEEGDTYVAATETIEDKEASEDEDEEEETYLATTSDTTEEITTTTTEAPKDATLPPELQHEFSWMKLRPDGTISCLKGRYTLGQNETSPVDSHCTTPTSAEGYCTLLKDCTKLYPCLKEEISFKDNFCSINKEFAGVCCPIGDIPKTCLNN